MCFRKPINAWKAMRERSRNEALSWWTPLILAAGVAVLAVCVVRVAHGPAPSDGPVTQQQADQALAWLKTHMPNTPFVAAEPDPDAPSLVRLRMRGSTTPTDFDPVHHLLLIGLVVNLDNPHQLVAPGYSR